MIQTLEEFQKYLTYSKNFSPRTIPNYISNIRRFAEKYNLSEPQQITPLLAEEYMEWRTAQGIGQNTNVGFMNALRAFVMFCHKRKGIQFQIELFEPVKRKKVYTEYVTAEEVNRMVECCPRERDRIILLLAFTSGARRAELAQFSVEGFMPQVAAFKCVAKGDKEHTYYFDHTLSRRIEVYLQMERIQSGPVFRNTTGRALGPASIALIVSKYARLAGLQKKVTTHTMRHGFGTAMSEAGADMREIQEQMGHESILTTQRYVHISDQRQRAAINKYAPKMVDNNPINVENLGQIYEKRY